MLSASLVNSTVAAMMILIGEWGMHRFVVCGTSWQSGWKALAPWERQCGVP
jgi:hypothetical protein